MQIIVLFILFLYLLLILKYWIGWTKNKATAVSHFSPKVSVIIAMRNEQEQVLHLLSELNKQVYPIDKLEFILVNDHSTDSTLELLENSAIDNLRVVNMPEGMFGKKSAIARAMKDATGEIILASDADCSFSPIWVHTMVAYFTNKNIKLVSGPVSYHRQKGIFLGLQTLEFISLIGSGAGSIGVKNAIFCNGANMAYRKADFLELNNFENDEAVSGDDVFLLHSIKEKYKNAIAFAKDENAIVLTGAVRSAKSFINQRKRWTAKTSGYKDFASIYASFLVLFTNLLLVLLFFGYLYSDAYLQLFLLFYALKFSVDFLLLLPVLSFFKRKDLLKWILPFELFYAIYIIFIVILSFTKSFEWKGRIHKK
ncbi:MAG: glycosyltransferase [Flavobacteriales bacterium]|jgi:cellulose synthase/poly-beta-1,6-N-acetylglucosamine synthase-like glycosyltransferase|nr:glycosyltransferase [Flavobacteriales bacterium]MBT5089916.1 glycosyltransferase [Flavobacteriales bacterium]